MYYYIHMLLACFVCLASLADINRTRYLSEEFQYFRMYNYITIIASLWGSTDILSVGIKIFACLFLNKENKKQNTSAVYNKKEHFSFLK